MGAWGIHTFEDDHNADWLDALIENEQPLAFFRECLDLEGIDELEYMHGTGVLCPAVMIDALLHGPTADLPREALEWLEKHKKLKVARLLPKAIAGLDRLLDDTSEMNELWKDNEELYPQWRKRILALRRRLKKAAAPKA
jgi:hypothetical protein